jgi:hypothetical protein
MVVLTDPFEKVRFHGDVPVKLIFRLADDPLQMLELPLIAAEEDGLTVTNADPMRLSGAKALHPLLSLSESMVYSVVMVGLTGTIYGLVLIALTTTGVPPALYPSFQGGEPVKLKIRLADCPLQIVVSRETLAAIAPTVIFTESNASGAVTAAQPKLVAVVKESFIAVILNTDVVLIAGVVYTYGLMEVVIVC